MKRGLVELSLFRAWKGIYQAFISVELDVIRIPQNMCKFAINLRFRLVEYVCFLCLTRAAKARLLPLQCEGKPSPAPSAGKKV